MSREPTRVLVLGTCDGLPELVQALERHDDVDVYGIGERAHDAAGALETGGIEVVLYATPGDRGWEDELVAIREHTIAPVVLLSSSRSGELLEQALEAGVAEAMLLPQLVENVAFAVRRASASSSGSGARPPVVVDLTGEARIVTVFSPKGGTGKTVLATNLGTIFAKEFGKSTLLIDLDLQFGDTAIVLGIEPKKTLHDLVTAPGELDSEKLAGYTIRHESGLHLLPAPLRPQDADLVSDAKLARLLDVARASYDVIIVDSAPFLHGPILTALDRTTDLLLICNPEVPTLKDVHLSLHTLSLLAFPPEKVRLVINHAHMNGGLRRSEVEDALGLDVAYEVPNDRAVSLAVNRGVSVAFVDTRAEFTEALRELSSSLFSLPVPTKPSRRAWLAPRGKAKR